jgi:hypothetical protein
MDSHVCRLAMPKYLVYRNLYVRKYYISLQKIEREVSTLDLCSVPVSWKSM